MTRLIATLILFNAVAFAQLTADQKIADFQSLSALYAKQYAPYEWKRTLFGFDLLETKSWLDRVRATKDDLEFYDLQVEYVASLNDTHDSFSLPSDFVASLGMTVDIYDGKVLIDNITRSRLPVATYPFVVGDELVSVDGKPVEDLLKEFAKYSPQSNPRSARRQTAARLVFRPQSRMPFASRLGTAAMIVVKRDNGNLESYTIPWLKTGTPVFVGPVPSPKTAATARAAESSEAPPDYMQTLLELQHSGVSDDTGVLNYGSRTPIFALPSGFVQRQGTRATDFFYSGTYQSDGLRIGYIRIPNYSPPVQATAVLDFEAEIAFFEANTDGLVVDEMRNTGGLLCFGENIAARLIPYPFHATGFAYRATWTRVNSFWNNLNSARAQRADQWIIDLYEFLYNDVSKSYMEQRGLTGPLPICTPSLDRQPAADNTGKIIAYSKPAIMIIDEFSTSTADSVPSMFQDAKRGPLFGYRTNGAGGTNTSFPAGAWSEGTAGMTLGLQVRKAPVATTEFPTSAFIETVGVRPDIENDYMTRDNLLQGGRPFVAAFTAAIVEQIKKSK